MEKKRNFWVMKKSGDVEVMHEVFYNEADANKACEDFARKDSRSQYRVIERMRKR
jgi:hypothetical protein